MAGRQGGTSVAKQLLERRCHGGKANVDASNYRCGSHESSGPSVPPTGYYQAAQEQPSDEPPVLERRADYPSRATWHDIIVAYTQVSRNGIHASWLSVASKRMTRIRFRWPHTDFPPSEVAVS